MANPSKRGGGALAVGILALTLGACSPEPVAQPTTRIESVRVLDIVPGEQDRADVGDGGTGGVQVTSQEITLEPGSGTGPHCHYGQLVLAVRKGELTHYTGSYPDGVRVYRIGDTAVESARQVYEGVNRGPGDLVLMVSYTTPAERPLTETDLTQCER